MKCPADVFTKSKRPYPTTFPEPKYEDYDDVVRVSKNGYVKLGTNLVYVSDALGHMHVGVTEQPDGRLLVTFAGNDVGFVDKQLNRIIPL